MQADARAFRALMRHVKDIDMKRGTVLMVQVQNEVGMLGAGRDHSPEANRVFEGPVPEELLQDLRAHRDRLSPELIRAWNPDARNWRDAFGARSAEVFMAWHYARYIGQVAAAGRKNTASHVRERAVADSI